MRVILVLVLLLVSGCSGGGPPAGERGPTTTTTTGTAPHTATTPPVPPRDLTMDWNDCRGLWADFVWPRGQGPGKPPGNWPPNDAIGAEVTLTLMDCARFSLGPFERPLHIILEAHGNETVPDKCLDGRKGSFWAVGSLWVDDPEIAAYLKAEYGLPVVLGTIAMSVTSTSNLDHMTWVWNATGLPPSTLKTWAWRAGPTKGEVEDRYFWFNGKGISYVDLDERIASFLGRVEASVGRMELPMLNAQKGMHDWVGRGQYEEWEDATGEIHMFRDTRCAKPL